MVLHIFSSMFLLSHGIHFRYCEEVTVACLYQCTVFFNGSQEYEKVIWPRASKFHTSSNFVAVNITMDDSGRGGAMVTSDPSKFLETDNKRWKCKAGPVDESWAEVDFDDSSWAPASFVALNGDCRFPGEHVMYDQCFNVSKMAVWIWSLPDKILDEDLKDLHKSVYCRIDPNINMSWSYSFQKTAADGDFGGQVFANIRDYVIHLIGVIVFTFVVWSLLMMLIPSELRVALVRGLVSVPSPE